MLTEFNIRTLSYGPSFSRWFVAHELRAWAINQQEKTRIHNLQKNNQENELRKKFIVSLRLLRRMGKETSASRAQNSTTTNYWRASIQNYEPIFIGCSTKRCWSWIIAIMKSTKFTSCTRLVYFSWKKWETCKKLVTKMLIKLLKSRRPYSRIRPAKLTNHSTLTNWQK